MEQFSNLKKLRYLKLNHNRIRNLPRDVFLNTRIQLLDLSNNYISVWPVNSFSDIGFTLRSVRLNYNFLEYLDSTMFMNCQYLQELDVSHNQLKVLPDNTFSVLNNLTLLNLSNNPFITTNFKELLLNIPQLRILNLKSTGLFTVPTLYLKYLTDLDLSTNQIQDVDSLIDLPLLRRLNIADNKIFNITLLGRNLPASLRVLDISRNPIRKIAAHDFTPVRRLEELVIQDIKIINMEAFAKLHSLRTLKISSQANFSEIISKVRALQKLYINFKEHKLDNTFFSRMLSNTKINLIEITGNKLRLVAANAFYGLSRNHNLKLVIKNTVISDLPSGVFYSLKHIPKLSIDLIDNKLSALSPNIFYPNATSWDNIGTRIITGGLDISGNPLQCDCGHVWLGHWLRRWLRETAQINIINKEEAKRMLMVSISYYIITYYHHVILL